MELGVWAAITEGVAVVGEAIAAGVGAEAAAAVGAGAGEAGVGAAALAAEGGGEAIAMATFSSSAAAEEGAAAASEEEMAAAEETFVKDAWQRPGVENNYFRFRSHAYVLSRVAEDELPDVIEGSSFLSIAPSSSAWKRLHVNVQAHSRDHTSLPF